MTDTAGTSGSPQTIDIEKRVRQYIVLRDLIADKQSAFDAEIAKLKGMRDALGTYLLAFLRKTNQESARTEAGTVSITSKDSATVEDPHAFRQFCIDGNWALADLRANASKVKDWLEEHDGHLPPGVKFSSFARVTVRRS